MPQFPIDLGLPMNGFVSNGTAIVYELRREPQNPPSCPFHWQHAAPFWGALILLTSVTTQRRFYQRVVSHPTPTCPTRRPIPLNLFRRSHT